MGEIFTEREISEEEVTAILEDESQLFEMDTEACDDDYLSARRKLLGPVADITHPEFGRQNRESETFGLFYRISLRPLLSFNLLTKQTEEKIVHHVDEYILDNDNNLVSPDVQ